MFLYPKKSIRQCPLRNHQRHVLCFCFLGKHGSAFKGVFKGVFSEQVASTI